ncbi:hypothetical protein YQE_10520, partial [Dendroctonus ponderosae]
MSSKEGPGHRAMHQRLQAEYDALFLRAIYYLYSSQKLRGWQFLAVVPYNVVSTRTLWKIYYILHMPDEKADDIINFSLESDFKKMVWEKDLRDHFEDKLTSLDDAEVYYLLNTFANMALARSGSDVDFIYSCTMDILQVGFVSQLTQESCSKSSRILLSHLLSKHPSLLSAILKKVQENVDKIGSLVLYLYEDIPLSIWNLAEEDFSIIERLLLNYPAGSNQTKLARMVLSRLNWDLLSYEKHCATAILVLKAVDQEPSYLQVRNVARVRDNQPLASFVAVLMTTWGHLVPLICSNGLKQLIVLQSHQKHEAVLFALYQIVPIFITCQECLINSNTFQDILVNLLNADRGYISYAKSFIVAQNTVLQQFGNMVETQIVNYAAYDLRTPRLLVRLWMNSLVSIPNWSKDNGVLYLLDVIVRGTFFYEDGLQVIYENLWDLYQTTTPQESASLISRFKWASSGGKSGYSLIQNSLAQYPWLAFIFLEVEHQVKEVKTALWMEVLKELSEQKGKISVDNAIKNATSTLKISTFSSSYLSIYRWSQQALDTPLDHPLLPLFWQKFFILFLDRLPVAESVLHHTYPVAWYECVNYNQISSDQSGAMKQWRIANFREKSSFNRPLSNPGRSIESVDPAERIIRSNNGRNQSEQKALDGAYQELIPQLFTSVMKRVCKPVPCKGNRQQESAILCSGPAMIEAKQNERIDHEILINRQAYESLLEKSLQMPPVALYTASVAIQQCIRVLQERVKTNPELAELGVELFYHLLAFLQDDIVLYLPARSLFVSCIEKLGQSHICGVESEMPRLLQLILKEPSLGEYLAPYFLPKNCDSANILLMYSTIIHQMSKKYDVVFALISKFDVESWLNQKTPNLSQRTQFIGNIIQALSILGYDPPVDTLTLHGLYRKHLVTVFEFEFPEHYGEIIIELLKSSNGTPENNLIAESVWIDILNSLAKPSRISPKAPLREQLRQYSQYQKVLSHQELLETCSLFSRHFTEERLSYGLYGLFPKCRKYVDIFALMLGMAGHGLIVSMLNTHQGLLGDKLSEQIWPYIRDMFAPWLIPYSVNSLKDNMANWIQQLADDRSVLLPWIPADRECAEKMLRCFCECIHFLLDALPASFNILSYVFQWYASSFAHTSVKEYILIPVHNAFIAFPWNKFWPSMIDLEFMLRVIDQYLPECHSFLGYIFMSIPWVNWMNSFADAPAQIKNRVYYCFLSLLVKLSVEPKVRMDHLVKVRAILIQAENFDWAHLEPVGFQHIMDWVVMSCNTNVIFKNDVLDLDYRLLCLLKLVSGYLNDLDCVVTAADEMELLLKEILSAVNISEISEIVLNVLIRWVENKTSEITIKAFLKTMGTTITDYKHLGTLYEATLTSYFNTNVIGGNSEEPPTWRKVSTIVNICPAKPVDFEQALLVEGFILTLNVVLLQRVYKNADLENLLNHCLGWLERIKLRHDLESKMPLLWFAVVNLALHHCVKDEGATGGLLRRFCRILLRIAEEASPNNWGRGLLTAIGLSKTEAISLKFICRAMAGYVLAQLPDIKGSSQKVRLAANAACAIGTPGGNTECPKVLLGLDFGQSQGKIKDCAEVALAKIQDPCNSMHNANSFLKMLLKQFYIKPYLKGLDNYEL